MTRQKRDRGMMGKRREVLVADAQLTVPERTGLFTTAWSPPVARRKRS